MAADDNAARLLDLQTIIIVISTHPVQLSGRVDRQQAKIWSDVFDPLPCATNQSGPALELREA